MIKENQYVLLIKKHVIFPYNQLIIDLTEDIDKQIIDKCMQEKNNQVLLVFIDDNKQNVSKLPKIGVVATINKKFAVDSKKSQVTIAGLDRVIINNYQKIDGLEGLQANIKANDIIAVDEALKIALINTLKSKIRKLVEYKVLGNSIINILETSNSLTKISDVTAAFIPLFRPKKIQLLNELNSVKRMEMLIEYITTLIRSYEMEISIDNQINEKFIKTQQEMIIKEKVKFYKTQLGELSTKESLVDEYKEKSLELLAPTNIKEKLNKEIKKYELLTTGSPEMDITANYIETLLSLPYTPSNNYNKNINNIAQVLNNNHYGLDKVKERIIEFVISNMKSNKIKKPIICLLGPPGVGKTSLTKSIATALKKEYIKISVGGLSDSAEIMGHRKTYLGAVPGRIIQNMQKVKSNDPIFVIDEIDKISYSQNSDPASCFLEILDYEQNQNFKDNYVEESYNLSNVTFITTANDYNNIPYPLLDRMEIIELSSYTLEEKVQICKKYLMKRIMKEYSLKENDILYTTSNLEYIINFYTKEAGIRELERVLATIVRKIVCDMAKKKENDKYCLNQKLIESYLGKPIYDYNKILKAIPGVVNALVWTRVGGDILPIETIKYKGTEQLLLTGQLGDVMQESVNCAYSYIKANADKFDIIQEEFKDTTIHIHFPSGAIKKDGPSAGSAITSAIISLLKNKEIDNTVAFTGEITLTGRVLKIGGLKEKVLGAIRSGVKTIYIPKSNECDLEEIKKITKKAIKFILVEEYHEIYYNLFEKKNNI